MGQKEFGPRPRIATAQPKRSDSDRLDQIIALLSEVLLLLQPQPGGKCNVPRPYGNPGGCDKPTGHEGRHQYCGLYWTDNTTK